MFPPSYDPVDVVRYLVRHTMDSIVAFLMDEKFGKVAEK